MVTFPGYNHNVGYGGLTLHAQTEHVGQTAHEHRIVSHLFFGGSVVSSRVLACQLGNVPDLAKEVCRLIRKQHKALLKDLQRGKLDDNIASTPGTGDFQAIRDEHLKSRAPERKRRPSEAIQATRTDS